MIVPLPFVASLALLGADAPNTLTADQQRQGWILLFNGKDLSGLEAEGAKDSFSVDAEGNLACRGAGGWIHSVKEYRDFRLTLEYKVSPGGNSGVFLRARKEGDPAFTGMEVQILDDAGKPPDTHSTGALYDEVRPDKNKSKPAGEWNAYDITCLGNELRVSLNGEQLYAINLDTTPDKHNQQARLSMRAATGFIGVQDHGSPVWFRNIKLLPLDASRYPGNTSGWTAAFDGQTLDGWEPHGKGKWEVRDGVIVGTGGPGYLATKATYRDVEFKARVRINPGGNSGVFCRAKAPTGPDRVWPDGGEAQINNNDPVWRTGSLYGVNRAAELFTTDGTWFELHVRVVGERWVVRADRRVVLDTRCDRWMDPGFIALQAHDEDGTVEFTDLWVRPLE